MKEMIPKNSALVDGDDLTFNYHDEAFTDSLKLSMGAKISHKAVIQLITTHIDDVSEFGRVAFQMEPFATKGGVQKMKICRLNEEQATFVISMMKNTKPVVAFKKEPVRQFYLMKEQIKTLVEARQEYPQLTATIRMAHAEPKPYNYTNEIDMINRIALGMSAKQFRELKGIPKGESIRPHLTKEQLTLIDQLQKADIGLLLAIPEFAERKKKLAEYAASRRLTG